MQEACSPSKANFPLMRWTEFHMAYIIRLKGSLVGSSIGLGCDNLSSYLGSRCGHGRTALAGHSGDTMWSTQCSDSPVLVLSPFLQQSCHLGSSFNVHTRPRCCKHAMCCKLRLHIHTRPPCIFGVERAGRSLVIWQALAELPKWGVSQCLWSLWGRASGTKGPARFRAWEGTEWGISC